MSKIRVAVFPEKPEALLIYANDGCSFSVPELQAPFEKIAVAIAFGPTAKVIEAVPGRWTPAIERFRSQERQARGQRHRQKELTLAAIAGGSSVGQEKERTKLIVRKQEVDEKSRQLKEKIAEVKVGAYVNGVYVSDFSDMQSELNKYKSESHAIQTRLSELRKEEKEENKKIAREEAERFKQAARKILEPEVFEKIEIAAAEEAD